MRRAITLFMGIAFCFLVTVLLAKAMVCAEQASQPEGYSFTLDGESFSPESISLNGTPDELRAGDVVFVKEIAVVLGPEGTYNFKSSPREDGRLFLVSDDGIERTIAADVEWGYPGDHIVIYNPLSNMTPEQIHALRGIRLDEWPEGIAGKLDHVDPARVCITITNRTAQGEKNTLPPLPRGLWYLNVDESSNQGLRDYSALGSQDDLRFLRLRAMTVRGFDAALLKGKKELRYLDLWGQTLRHQECLGELSSLRELHLSWSMLLMDISFVQGMANLRVLDIERSRVDDLSPLGRLGNLISVKANITLVKKLPQGPLPKLRSLEVMSTKLSDEQVAAFRTKHPQCRVLHRWDEALRAALPDVTRIRVRSGGTCHRRIEQEKTLVEVKQPREIRELIENIEINESGSGFHCMCCGEPSFEFYSADQLVVTLGFHHGESLRWPGGWPGDGQLTPASAKYLSRWLADRGVKGPEEDRESEKRQELALQRRAQRYEELIPEGVLNALMAASSDEESIAAFEKGVKDPIERAELYLKLFGCDNGCWNLFSGLDKPVAEKLLPRVTGEQVAEAIVKAGDDFAAANGAARWLFSEKKWSVLDQKTLDAVLGRLARQSLGHPRKINRRRTIAALARIKGDAAVAVLRSELSGGIEVRTLPPEEEDEPAGWINFAPLDSDVPEECSERAYAAFVLAELGDRESLPLIQREAARAEGEDRKLLDEAIRLLKGSEP